MFIFSFSQKSGAKNSNYEVTGEEMGPSKAKNKNWKFFFSKEWSNFPLITLDFLIIDFKMENVKR